MKKTVCIILILCMLSTVSGCYYKYWRTKEGDRIPIKRKLGLSVTETMAVEAVRFFQSIYGELNDLEILAIRSGRTITRNSRPDILFLFEYTYKDEQGTVVEARKWINFDARNPDYECTELMVLSDFDQAPSLDVDKILSRVR